MLGSILTGPEHNTGPGLWVSTGVLRGREGPQGDLISLGAKAGDGVGGMRVGTDSFFFFLSLSLTFLKHFIPSIFVTKIRVS